MNPSDVLEKIYQTVLQKPNRQFSNPEIGNMISDICLCPNNRALTRLLMSCTLAKICNDRYKVCMPYTAINQEGCFSGRTYDESYISPFIFKYNLPCNASTAFLTPTLRNITAPLSSSVKYAGNNPDLYRQAIIVLERIDAQQIKAKDALFEIVRLLVNMREEKKRRFDSLIKELNTLDGSLPLSSSAIITLISQHLQCKKSSRLPVLIVSAAYKCLENLIGEVALPLNKHNAADKQTKSLGDVEICLESNQESVVTVYEMKERSITQNDINIAIEKIQTCNHQVHNYIFITTNPIDKLVSEYASQLYEKTGTEFAILDCLGFITHFLHFFHRKRAAFLDCYQDLLLNEPDSAVSSELKEAFLVLRKTAESSNDY